MTETPVTFPELDMLTIIMDTGTEHHKTDVEMTYLKKKNINESTRHKLRKKDVYETYMHKIYNIIVGKANEQLKEKVASDATFQAFKAGQHLIRYLVILKKDMLLESILTTPHPLFMHDEQGIIQHNTV